MVEKSQKQVEQKMTGNDSVNPYAWTDDAPSREASISYGMTREQVGDRVQGIEQLRRQRLFGDDPASSRLREGRNRQLRMARAAGASPEELAQIRRNAEMDIGQADYSNRGQALGDYQSLIGNILSGREALSAGVKGQEVAYNSQVATPKTGALGSVICTELYRQGYMPAHIYHLDSAYGERIKRDAPHIYWGYFFLASPVVKLMRKSKAFTYLISIPGMAWARDMAGQKNIFGSCINYLGQKLCGTIGRTLYGRQIQKTST